MWKITAWVVAIRFVAEVIAVTISDSVQGTREKVHKVFCMLYVRTYLFEKRCQEFDITEKNPSRPPWEDILHGDDNRRE